MINNSPISTKHLALDRLCKPWGISFCFSLLICCSVSAFAAQFTHPAKSPSQKWITTWTASVQGPYPTGNPSVQPNLSFALPEPLIGAQNQSFRIIVKPDLWGNTTRIRLSNAMGTQPITFDNVYAGLQLSSAELFKHSNQTITFQHQKSITIQPGEWAWSDPVALPFAKGGKADFLDGRKLAVSFHINGTSGPMTWHAKALTTSYISAPNSGAVSRAEAETPFKYTTASWFFLDAVDMMLPKTTKVILNFGDSITDGTSSTMNADDRWPDVLSRRMHSQFGHKVVILNAGIGGNQIAGPAEYSPQKPFAGGPSSLMRLDRDVLSLSGVNLVVWLEGINDFSKNGNASLDLVTSKLTEGIQRLNQAGIKVLGATVGSALNSTSAAHGSLDQDTKRKGLNEFIKTSTLFEGYVDFDQVSSDPTTGEMRAEFVPESTTGGAGEKLHPNRVGYQAMGNAFDLRVIAKILNIN